MRMVQMEAGRGVGVELTGVAERQRRLRAVLTGSAVVICNAMDAVDAVDVRFERRVIRRRIAANRV